MKRLGSMLLILVTSMALMTGCTSISNDEDKKNSKNPLEQYKQYKEYLPVLAAMLDHSIPVPPPPYVGPTYLTATDGDYTDKVIVGWSAVEGAVSYKVYRSDSGQGTFNFIGTVDAEIINAAASNMSKSISAMATSTAPSVSIPTPANGATNVAIDTLVTADFNQSINCSTVTSSSFTLKQGSTSVAGIVICSGSTATFKPSANLANTTVYTAKVTTAVKNPEGIAMPADYTWSFTTAVASVPVLTPPKVSIPTPANGAINVAVDTIVTADFNENIKCSTVTSSSFTLKKGSTSVAGTVFCSGSTATFTPSADLAANTVYTATVTTAIQDLEGAAMSAAYTWTFNTGTAPPQEGSYYFTDTTNITPGKHYYYKVSAVDDDGDESTTSPADDGFARVSDNVPGKVTNCSASDGTYTNRVTITWTAAASATYYKVYRTNGSTLFMVGGNITGTSFDDTTAPPGLYSYKVAPFNATGEGVSSDSDTGFRGLTNQEFFDEAYKNENAALSRLQLLQKTGTDMLGTETIYDKDGDGTCVYKATADIFNMTGRATITFTNFCDLYLTMNGTQVLDADLSMNGTITGQLNLAGIYNGYIRFDITITGGSATGGYYYVSQNGGAETALPGDYVQPF
jgi:hypothetical protein